MQFDRKKLSGIQRQGRFAFQVVNELRSFWRVKGFFLTLKCYPSVNLSNYETEEIMLYLAKYTQLMTTSVRLLSKSQLVSLCKHMSLRDDRNMRLQVNCTSMEQGEVCVLLSGEAQITCEGSDVVEVLPRGSVFGAVQLFESILTNTHIAMDTADRITVTIAQGTILKISIEEFAKQVALKHESLSSKRKSMHELSLGASVELTEDEREALAQDELRRKAEAVLDPRILVFLKEIHFMPPPPQNVYTGRMGRGFDVYEDSPQMLYVIIDGTLRLELRPNQKRTEGHAISHTRIGHTSTQFRTSHAMPLVRFDKGALFTFTEDAFHLGSKPEDFSNSPPIPRAVSRLPRRTATVPSKIYPFVPYHFTAVFEGPSVYFAIPMKTIRAIVAGLTFSHNSDTTSHLDVTSNFVNSRVKSLLPWLNGELCLSTGRERKPFVVAADPSTAESDVIFGKTTVEPTDTMRTGLIGTFIKGGFVNVITDEFKRLFITEAIVDDDGSIDDTLDEGSIDAPAEDQLDDDVSSLDGAENIELSDCVS